MARIILVACGKEKLTVEAPARELYTGPVFRMRRDYALRTGQPWYVLSAKHGLVMPNQVLRPYDFTVGQYGAIDHAGWCLQVALDLISQLPQDMGTLAIEAATIEIHGGAGYCRPLAGVLKSLGFSVETPTAGMSIGVQAKWYGKQASKSAGAVSRS